MTLSQMRWPNWGICTEKRRSQDSRSQQVDQLASGKRCLNCQPTNCDHANVLPFPNSDYGALAATDKACVDFNGGSPCSFVKGHDHLVGIASTGGDFNIAWHVKLVFFTHDGFTSGKTNTRITTLSQFQTLTNNGDVVISDTPITFHCPKTSAETYEKGTAVVIPYP
jgi:hypothetical protein